MKRETLTEKYEALQHRYAQAMANYAALSAIFMEEGEINPGPRVILARAQQARAAQNGHADERGQVRQEQAQAKAELSHEELDDFRDGLSESMEQASKSLLFAKAHAQARQDVESPALLALIDAVSGLVDWVTE